MAECTSLRYDLGDNHPLVVRSAPYFALDDGTKLGGLPRDSSGALFDFRARPRLQTLASRWRDRIKYVSVNAGDAPGLGARAASRWFGAPAAARESA